MKHQVLALFVLLTLVSAVSALTPPQPITYQTYTPDRKFVFVMIAPVPFEEELKYWNGHTAAALADIRGRYVRSGMYRNDGSTQPVWTIDWYSYSVETAGDGIHIVRHGGGEIVHSLDVEGVAFFANGQLTRSYTIAELVGEPERLQKSFDYIWLGVARLDDERMQYTLSTNDGNWFVFDVRTGEIVSEYKRAPSWVWWLAVGSLVGLGIVLSLRRRQR